MNWPTTLTARHNSGMCGHTRDPAIMNIYAARLDLAGFDDKTG